MNARLHVAITCGGRSAEHEISLLSAAFITSTLRKRHTCTVVYIDRDGGWWHVPPAFAQDVARFTTFPQVYTQWEPVGLWRFPDGVCLFGLRSDYRSDPIDVVFPALHGPFGEDGTIQGLCECMDVPYVGAGVLGSAIGMDKVTTKRILRSQRIPVVPFLAIEFWQWQSSPERWIRTVEAELVYPVFVKPSNLGSSIGIRKVTRRDDLPDAITQAFQYDDTVLVEQSVIPVREIECSVLDGAPPEASVIGEIVYTREFYDYTAKYLDDSTELRIPAEIPSDVADHARRLAVAAFIALRCQGMARVDFLYRPDSGELFVNEINTIPGFTAYSMYHRLWQASGLPPEALLDRLITLAIARHRRRRRHRRDPDHAMGTS